MCMCRRRQEEWISKFLIVHAVRISIVVGINGNSGVRDFIWVNVSKYLSESLIVDILGTVQMIVVMMQVYDYALRRSMKGLFMNDL